MELVFILPSSHVANHTYALIVVGVLDYTGLLVVIHYHLLNIQSFSSDTITLS
jgi:hypothetical protein